MTDEGNYVIVLVMFVLMHVFYCRLFIFKLLIIACFHLKRLQAQTGLIVLKIKKNALEDPKVTALSCKYI